MDDPFEGPIAVVGVLPLHGCWCGLDHLVYVRTHFTSLSGNQIALSAVPVEPTDVIIFHPVDDGLHLG